MLTEWSSTLGRRQMLGLVIESYRPSVTCRGPLTHSPWTIESFEYLARHFPVSKQPMVFGFPLAGKVAVSLPFELKSRCK